MARSVQVDDVAVVVVDVVEVEAVVVSYLMLLNVVLKSR